MNDKPKFRAVLATPSESVAVVEVEGAVDIYSASEFKEILHQGIDGGAKQVIVDLGNVTIIDSTGLGVLVSGAKRIGPRHGSLAIVCSDANLVHVFEITGLDRLFNVYANRAEALRAAQV
jgi:anti-sigma B factor antagonist